MAQALTLPTQRLHLRQRKLHPPEHRELDDAPFRRRRLVFLHHAPCHVFQVAGLGPHGDATGEAAGVASEPPGVNTGPETGVALRSGAETGVATIGVGASIGGVNALVVGTGDGL